jgi:hypothetical protein
MSVLSVKPSQLKQILILAIQNHKDVLIVGKPGIGKTDIVNQAGIETDAIIIPDYPGLADPTDYKGLPMPDADGKSAHFRPFGNMLRLINAGEKRMVLFEDELGQAPESVQKALMSVNLTKKVNGQKFGQNVSIIAATNRREDKAGVTGLLETVKSRFDIIVHLEPDLDDWVKWALDNGQPIEHIAFNRYRSEHILMTTWKPTPDMVNSPSPRTIAKVGNWMLTKPPAELEYIIYAGCAGQAYAAEEMGFLKIFRELPSIDRILLNPDKEEIPEKPDVLYATCAALTGKASPQTLTNIMKYANRMRPQFSVMLVKDIIAKDKALVNTKAFIDWSVKHSNVLI